MAVPFDKLVLFAPSRPLHPTEGRAFARRWEAHRIPADEPLWYEGALANHVGLVLSGELVATVSGQEVGRLRPGDFVGETSALCSRPYRSATLVAAGVVELALLPGHEIEALREEAHQFHERLLERALQCVAKRLRAVDLAIARCSKGPAEAPMPATPPVWERVVKSMCRALADTEPGLCLLTFLRGLHGFGGAPPSVFTWLGRALEPQHHEAGSLLLREGEQGDSAYLVASGSISVFRNVRGRRAEPLGSISPSDLLGALCLVRPRRRTATCLVEEDSWVYRMDREAYAKLPHPASSYWKAFLLSSLTDKLVRASRQLAESKSALQDHCERGVRETV